MNILTDINGKPLFLNQDQDLQKALDYFLGFINPGEWIQRKQAIENKISFEKHINQPENGKTYQQIRITDTEDTIGWYLYLLEKQLYDPQQYEYIQGARVIPIFKRFGSAIDQLKAIEGMKKKVRYLVKQGRAAADNILFEMLVALLWRRNGWKVSFIPEKPPLKSPDILAEKNGKEWYIECKRMAKTSEYSEKERVKFSAMLKPLSKTLMEKGILLDITFHIELKELPDNYLEQKLATKISLSTQPMQLIANDTWEVSIDFVDYLRIRNHLKQWSVKHHSPQLCNVIAGKNVDPSTYSVGISAMFANQGSGTGNGQYITDIDMAYGVNWRVDAEDAIARKARDIKSNITKARDQLPEGKNAAIHVGIETIDGALVEELRMQKITETLGHMDTKGKKLSWI